jgi:hypothetical protein
MSAYYSLQNGNNPSGNFSVANTFRPSFMNTTGNYNISLNNAGLVPQNAGVNVTSNAFLNQLVVSNATNNSSIVGTIPVEKIVNANPGVLRANLIDTNTIHDGNVNIAAPPPGVVSGVNGYTS